MSVVVAAAVAAQVAGIENRMDRMGVELPEQTPRI